MNLSILARCGLFRGIATAELSPLLRRLHACTREFDKFQPIYRVGDTAHALCILLSGGERQRVFLAMLLAQNTDVVLLDEPTTYLDAHHKFELMALLSTLKSQNKAVGIVLHELPLAFKFCDRLLLMKNGQIMQSGTPEELLKTGLIEHLFGVSLTPVMLDKEVEYIERKIHS